jgi:hypothetical protein
LVQIDAGSVPQPASPQWSHQFCLSTFTKGFNGFELLVLIGLRLCILIHNLNISRDSTFFDGKTGRIKENNGEQVRS